MTIILYLIFIAAVWVMGKRLGKPFPLKHGKYAGFIVPGIVFALIKILKKDIFNYGSDLMFLYGSQRGDSLYIIHWAVKIASLIIFMVFPLIYISIGTPDLMLTAFSCLFPIVGFILPDIDLKSCIRQKKESIMRDYPVFCTDIAVMAGAGLEITKAWEKVAQKSRKSLLYKEARQVTLKNSTGVLFKDALKDFSAHLAMANIHTFVTIINQEIKSGSGGMAAKLRECAELSWKNREDAARKKGEEAVSKLVFPLVLGLAGILLILGAPAVMIMKGV